MEKLSLRSKFKKAGDRFQVLSYGFLNFFYVSLDMCNVFGTLHGACAAYMVDPYVLCFCQCLEGLILFSVALFRLLFCLALLPVSMALEFLNP